MTHSFSRLFLTAFLTVGLSLSSVHAEKPAAPAAADAKSDTVVVFAAASLKTALDAIGKQWTAETGKTITASYAASSALAKQIESDAPADIFGSADLKWMDYAQEKKLIKPESRVSLLGNTLVLIAPKDAPVSLKIAKSFDLAGTLGDGKLATGDPKSVPVGLYAQEALTNLGVWDAVSPKIAATDNVRSALAFVARGEAKLGIVYQTDANSEPKVVVVDTFPASSHKPIVYPFALTASSKNPNAEAFLAYLKSPAAAKVFEGQGFAILAK